MQPLSESMPEAQFAQHINAMLSGAPYEALNRPGYQHPTGTLSVAQGLTEALAPSRTHTMRAPTTHHLLTYNTTPHLV
jgi:hypothetical protein